MFHNPNKTLINLILLSTLISGCADDRVTQIAREAADRQAQQNSAMAELNQEVASGTRRLVEADAQSRKEIVGVHRELQAERQRLDTGWNKLELERRSIAGERRTESMLVPIASIVGGTIFLSLVLGFCWYALVSSHRSDGADAELSELLVTEILSDRPHLLGGPSLPPLLESADSPERST